MATNKSYTDLSQSKVLSKILPTESADMYYKYVLPKSDKIHHRPEIGKPLNALEWYNKGYTFGGKEPVKMEEFCIPAWSLSALLDVLKFPELGQNVEGTWSILDYTGKYPKTIYNADNPVDACYEMILKLNELKML